MKGKVITSSKMNGRNLFILFFTDIMETLSLSLSLFLSFFHTFLCGNCTSKAQGGHLDHWFERSEDYWLVPPTEVMIC